MFVSLIVSRPFLSFVLEAVRLRFFVYNVCPHLFACLALCCSLVQELLETAVGVTRSDWGSIAVWMVSAPQLLSITGSGVTGFSL